MHDLTYLGEATIVFDFTSNSFNNDFDSYILLLVPDSLQCKNLPLGDALVIRYKNMD